MAEKPRVLVIGGTRGTGQLIVQRLLQEGYRVRALARDTARAREKLGPAAEIVPGDITKPDTLRGALKEIDHLIFTAGVTGRAAGEPLIRATIYDGVANTLGAASNAGFQGRLLYMTTVGVTTSSLAATLLNLVRPHLLEWRQRAEDEIRRSGVDYTIIRVGILTNGPAGQRAIEIGQGPYPLAFQYRISRADVAEAFVQALSHPGTRRTSFNIVGTSRGPRQAWEALFAHLEPDA
jgi:uncharacterized protein YbjT (DUF2867 family)